PTRRSSDLGGRPRHRPWWSSVMQAVRQRCFSRSRVLLWDNHYPYVRVTRRLLLRGHVLFWRLKKCAGRDSKIVRDFDASDICVTLGLSQTSYYVLTRFGKSISLTFHLLARAVTVEKTVIGRPPSQCCQI